MSYTRSLAVRTIGLLLVCAFLTIGAIAQDITYTVKSPEALNFLLQGIEKSDNIQFREAHDLFQKAVAADPGCAIAYFFLAGTASTGEEYQTMIGKAIDLAPKASEPEQVMIQTAKAGLEGNTAEVYRLTRRLVELVPKSPRARVALGYNLQGRQEFAEAEKEYRTAIQIDPNFAPAYNALAYTLADEGRYPEAIEALKKYSALRPKDPNPHDSMAELFLWMGDHKNSIAEYNASLALNPGFPGSIFGLGHNYVLMGQFDKARETYDSWLTQAKDHGDSSQVYYWRAASYFHEGKFDDGIAVWRDEDAFGKAHQDVYIQLDAHANMARMYREHGDYDKATAEIQQLRNLLKDSTLTQVAFDDNTRDIVGNEAIMYACQGKTAEAQAKLSELRKLAGPAPSPGITRNLHYVQGEIALGSNDYAAALAEFGQANLQSPHVKYHMAACYENQGKTGEAKEIYTWISKWNRNSLDLALVRPEARKKI